MKILLVEPSFPVPPKSKNHSNFLPIGLLKLGAYYKSNGSKVHLVRGNKEVHFHPDRILITSLFTYWSKYVIESVKFYKKLYPKADIWVGGIYASLMPEHCKENSECNKIFIGLHRAADKCKAAYELLPEPVDYQIIHAMRGCFRRCRFCGTWKIENGVKNYKRSIKDKLCSGKVIFYDNNFLANPYIKELLKEIISLKYQGKPVYCEAQSGFDGRLLTQEIAILIKKARFYNPRIAWDNSFSEYKKIENQIEMLVNAGYKSKDIYVFMLYNYNHNFNELELKRRKCWQWKVQIADCRYRPLNQTFDNFDTKKLQTSVDYYIHYPIWNDEEIKLFRRNVRKQNICVRHDFSFYSKELEYMRISKEKSRELRNMLKYKIKFYLSDAWFPEEQTKSTRTIQQYSNKTVSLKREVTLV